jgi:ribonuclease BN (tRNA processing enzyme)
MRVTVLGTGGASPDAARVQTGILVDAPPARLLIDCGSGIAHRLAAHDHAWRGITHLALTHFHADHTLDLVALIVGWKWGQLPPRREPLTLIGPAGTSDFAQRLVGLYNEPFSELPFPIHVQELEPGGTFEMAEGLQLSAAKVPHTQESVAYSLARDGQRVVFSGDTGYDPDFATWAAGCDLLILECSLPDELAIAMHLTPRQCGALAAVARPKQLALTHFYPPVEGVDIRAQVAESFDGPVALCVDGWTWTTEES